MQFEILGPLRVSSEDGALDLGSPAQRALLAVLLTSPNVAVSDDRLVDELWGATPPASAHHLVQVYVSRLRAVLGDARDDARILHGGSGYVLRLEPAALDAERFLAAVAQAREVRDRDPEAAEEILARAMRLWRGTPFADFPDPPPVVREEARYLARQHLEALETWFDLRLQLGQHRELVPELSALVEQNPYDEALHVQLALALYRCGRQAAALQSLRALQVRLREELGLDPSAEIRTLYRDLLLQAPQLSLEPPEPPSNLPTRLTSFVGRERELVELTELLQTGRLLTLTGPGGIGKTRLALELGRRLRAEFRGGVWWVDLGQVSDPGSVLDEVARVVGVSATGGVELGEAVVRALSRRTALLLLDNCEHLATAVAEAVAAVLGRTTGPRVLATSRTPLGIERERRWMVPPLSLPPEAASIAALTESDAAGLFMERARTVSPGFALDADNAEAVSEICRRLDGLSLAIEIAAARLSTLAPQEIVRQLDERFALLELPAVEALTRHKTVEAAVEASYVRLSETERTVFERLSTFVGPFDLDAAAVVGSRERDAPSRPIAGVITLLHASLLTPERDGEETRYRLLEPLREYAAARQRERGTEEEARHAHAEYHLDLAAQAGATLGTPEFARWMDRLARCYAEIRQALAWSLAHEGREVTLRAAPALREFWYRHGWASEAGRWAARMLEGDLGSVPPSLLGEVHSAAGFAADLAVDLSAAVDHADEALRLLRDGGSTESLNHALFGGAQVAVALGDLESMRRYALEALALCEAGDDRWGRARPLATLGIAALLGGSLEEARASLEEAVPLLRELGDLGSLVLMALTPLSDVACRQNDLAAAERYATEALDLASGTGWEAQALVSYGWVLKALGDSKAAHTIAGRALRVALESGLENWFRIALRDLAQEAAERGRLEDAALLLAASRRNMPAYGLDPAIYRPIEKRCREVIGDARFGQLAGQGETMSHDELMDFVGARERPVAAGDV